MFQLNFRQLKWKKGTNLLFIMMLKTNMYVLNVMVKLWHGHPSGNHDHELIAFSGILLLSQLNSWNILKLISPLTQRSANIFSVFLRINIISFAIKVLLDRYSISNFVLKQATLHGFVVASHYMVFVKKNHE